VSYVPIRLALAIACLITMAAAGPAAAKLPSGFTDTAVASFDGAMSLAFTPDGRMLIAGRTGQVRVFEHGELSDPALSLRHKICWDAERGVEGIAVDPHFASNGYVYLYYTFDKHRSSEDDGSKCASRNAQAPVNRVSRFTLGSNNIADPESEKVLLDNIPSYHGNHNGGDLGFGRDGYLYVSVGDGGCDYAGDSGCQDRNDASRDRHALLGKILRVTRNGKAPPSNPYTGPGTASCAGKGSTRPGLICRETYAWGLRNPFRFTFDPAARGTRFLINDVGEGRREEIDLGAPGADYGWNLREGHCRADALTICPQAPPGITDPIYDYPHFSGCSAITGGAFVPAGVWPASYEGGYLYGDYTCGKIHLLKRTRYGYQAFEFATRMGPVIDLVFGPDRGSQALYYTVWKDDTWQVRKIALVSPAGEESGFGRCGGGIGASLVVLGLCGVPYLRRRVRAR
jgi:glucose/arabinose dehydrogenase